MKRLKSHAQRWRQYLNVTLLRRLFTPTQSADYNARGVGIGLFVALSPTVGLQLPILFLLWFLLKRLYPAALFNLLVASAWTLTTNVLTAPPLYYLYVVTGRVLLGAWHELRGYEVFHSRLATSQPVPGGELTGWTHNLTELFTTFGAPLAIGWLPWALPISWLGYRWTLKLISARRARKHAVRQASSQDE